MLNQISSMNSEQYVWLVAGVANFLQIMIEHVAKFKRDLRVGLPACKSDDRRKLVHLLSDELMGYFWSEVGYFAPLY